MSVEKLLHDSGFIYSEEAVVRRLTRQLKIEEYPALKYRLSCLYRYADMYPREHATLFLSQTAQDDDDFLSVVTQDGQRVLWFDLSRMIIPCT